MTITPGRIINTIGLILFLYIIIDNYRTRAAFVQQQKKTDSANIASDKKYRADSLIMAGESKHLDSLLKSLNNR
jgi:hypothetical protein